jgi:hypothetical protein
MQPSQTKSAERLRLASQNTEKMLRPFPDYGKSPPEYIAAIVALMSEYPANIQDRLADTRYGIPSKTEFLPTPKIITEFAEKILQDERDIAEYSKRFSGKFIQGQQPRAPFRPFPQLWAEFGNEFMDHKVSSGKFHFETLDASCKALVTQGREAALYMLSQTTSADQGTI